MRNLLLPALLVLTALSGCLGGGTDDSREGPGDGSATDTFSGPPADYRSDHFDYPQVSGFGDMATVAAPGGGQGIWIHGDHLYWTNGGDLVIFDVSDPADPVQMGSLDGQGARDVDVLEWQGATYAALATNNPEMHIVDVSDPGIPELVVTVETAVGVHNLAAVPGTPYIYVSGASSGRIIQVVDITTPRSPALHSFDIPAAMEGTDLNSDGCHDITVRVDLGRAYCAGGGGQYGTGGGETFIWDITEEAGGVLDPTWVSFMDDPRVVYNHQAMVNDDGTILIVDDEFIAPNCFAAAVPGSPVPAQVPTGAAWIWDVSDEADPQLLGFVQNDAVTRHLAALEPEALSQTANCGSHFGDVIPQNDAFVMGWYGGGTILVDYSDPQDPVIADALAATGSTWDARVHRGHVYHASGDLLVTPLV